MASALQLKEYLGRHLAQPQLPVDSGAEHDASCSLSGAASEGATTAAVLQRLTAEACVRQGDLKPALTAYLASGQLGSDKARAAEA